MPFYDYALVHGDSEDTSTERDQESTDLTSATVKANKWAKEVRRLSGTANDTSQWPLTIVPSARDGGTALTPSLYQAADIRPDEWGDETGTSAALI